MNNKEQMDEMNLNSHTTPPKSQPRIGSLLHTVNRCLAEMYSLCPSNNSLFDQVCSGHDTPLWLYDMQVAMVITRSFAVNLS